MSRRALFPNQDGTRVHPRHSSSRPEDLHLYDGIGIELQRFQKAGFRLAVITSQAGPARGYCMKIRTDEGDVVLGAKT